MQETSVAETHGYRMSESKCKVVTLLVLMHAGWESIASILMMHIGARNIKRMETILTLHEI